MVVLHTCSLKLNQPMDAFAGQDLAFNLWLVPTRGMIDIWNPRNSTVPES
jgi:hypothetical protein